VKKAALVILKTVFHYSKGLNCKPNPTNPRSTNPKPNLLSLTFGIVILVWGDLESLQKR